MDDRYEVLMRTIEEGDFDKALTLLETGIRRGVPEALYLAGTVWLKRGNLEKAKDYLEEASSYGNEDAEELLEDSRFSSDLYQSTEPGEDTHNLSEPIEKQQDTDATSKKQFQDLQMKAESYRNTLIEARLEKDEGHARGRRPCGEVARRHGRHGCEGSGKEEVDASPAGASSTRVN